MSERTDKFESIPSAEEYKREKESRLAKKLWEKSLLLQNQGIVPEFFRKQKNKAFEAATLESLTAQYAPEAVSLLVKKHATFLSSKQEKLASEQYFEDCCKIALERESGFVFVNKGGQLLGVMLFFRLDQELVRLPKQLEAVEELRQELLKPVLKMPLSLKRQSALLIGAATRQELAEHDLIKRYISDAAIQLEKKGAKRCLVTCSQPDLFRVLQLKGLKSIKRVKRGQVDSHLLELLLETTQPKL